MDVNNPLKRWVNFQGVDGTKQWLQVIYERLPFFCFLCGILGHGEEDCPLRYEEGFREPAKGLPYGSWMRANDDLRRHTSNLGGSSRYIPPQVKVGSSSGTGRVGLEVFGVRGMINQSGTSRENVHPNLPVVVERDLNKSWRKAVGEVSVESSASFSSGVRRKVLIPKHKRKASEVIMKDGGNVGKKPSLSLRDEDIAITAETAEQSRREQ